MEKAEHYNKRILNLKTEIVSTAIAIIPFSLIFDQNQMYEPLLLVIPLCTLRLVKYLSVINMFDKLRSENYQSWRIIECILNYLIINHVLSCIWIAMGLHVDDVRETWVRRLPTPQPYGIRENPVLDDVSYASVYVHSLYFNVNTISHVAVGDITAITFGEHIYITVLIVFGTFCYVLTFGNIVSIVSELAPNQ